MGLDYIFFEYCKNQRCARHHCTKHDLSVLYNVDSVVRGTTLCSTDNVSNYLHYPNKIMPKMQLFTCITHLKQVNNASNYSHYWHYSNF